MKSLKKIKSYTEACAFAGVSQRMNERMHGETLRSDGSHLFTNAKYDRTSTIESQMINTDFSMIRITHFDASSSESYKINDDTNQTVYVYATNYYGDKSVGEYTVEVDSDDPRIVRLRAI